MMNVLNWFSRAERPAVTAPIRKDIVTVQLQDAAKMSLVEIANEGPPAQRQKLGSDRITVDVGGTKFFTTRSTLTSSSAYFESLLSDEWDEANDHADDEFIDEDPDVFRLLLSFMRRKIIKIEAINADVLHLAEFLGLEELLFAVKIRWYCAIGIGPVLHDDEEIAAAFDREHGGIAKALSDGLFGCFLTGEHELAEKDYAIMRPLYNNAEDQFNEDIDTATRVEVSALNKGGEGQDDKVLICGCGMIGALNGLSQDGYSLEQKQINHELFGYHPLTFSRKKHSIVRSSATGIFIPSAHDGKQTESKYVKQYAAYANCEELELRGEPSEKVIAPAGLSNSDPYDEVAVVDDTHWLEKNGFVNRELEIEEQGIFKTYISSLFNSDHDDLSGAIVGGGVYSRQILRSQQK